MLLNTDVGLNSRKRLRDSGRIFWALILLTTLNSANAFAEDHFDTIYFAEEANWPPYTPKAYGIAEEGLSLELMKLIFSRLGLNVEIELVPQKRVLQYMRIGKKDAVTVISKNQERLTYLDYSDVIIFGDKGLVYYLADREKPFEWQSYEDFRGLRIGVVSGANYGDEFKRAVEEFDLSLVEVTHFTLSINMLLAKRVDVILASEATIKLLFPDGTNQGKLAHASRPTSERTYHIAFSKKSRAKVLIPQVNRVIAELRKDGSLQTILNEYF